MKFIRFEVKGATRYGILVDDEVRDLEGTIFGELKETGTKRPLGEVKLMAPCEPSKIIGVGRNYKAHIQEMGQALPEEPLLFFKPSTVLIGPGDPIVYPSFSKRVDYEGELAVVMGKRARFVPRERAGKFILGYTCMNDVSARDLQKKEAQWVRSKGSDTFGPAGPCIVTDLDPMNVRLETLLNGKVVQSTNTSDMLFDVYVLVEYVTESMTLLPGDIIATGTPGGIGPMEVGDTVEVRIEGIGSLANPVVAEVRG